MRTTNITINDPMKNRLGQRQGLRNATLKSEKQARTINIPAMVARRAGWAVRSDRVRKYTAPGCLSGLNRSDCSVDERHYSRDHCRAFDKLFIVVVRPWKNEEVLRFARRVE